MIAVQLLEFNDIFAFDFLGEVDETDGGVLFGQLDGGSRPVVALACAGADDDGAGDAVLVPIVTGADDLQAMVMGGEHQVRLDVFAEKLAPFTVDVGLEVAADERDVADDQLYSLSAFAITLFRYSVSSRRKGWKATVWPYAS